MSICACSSYEEETPSITRGFDGGTGADCCASDAAAVDRVEIVVDASAVDSADGDAAEAGPTFPRVAKVVTSAYGACALLEDGRVKCWGLNSAGQLGLGDTVNRGGGDAGEEMGHALAAVPLGGKAIDLALGRYGPADPPGGFSCALLEGGAVKCWGYNGEGQLGRGNTLTVGTTKESMVDLPAIDLGGPAVAVSAGGFSVCALLTTGVVKCWGFGMDGELGYGDKLARGKVPGSMGSALPAVPLGAVAKGIAVGYRHACALLEDGRVKCWGDNTRGGLGINSTSSVGDTGGLDASLPAADLGGVATAVYAGNFNTCAVLVGGGLKCWGVNSVGNLGLGDRANRGDGADGGALLRDVPNVDLGDGGQITSVSLGPYLTCALRDDQTAKCWGTSKDGIGGLGDTEARGVLPNQMGESLPRLPFSNITSISHTSTCTCIVTEGRVKCWGSNSFGQLGLGDLAIRGDKPGYQNVLPFVDLGD